MNAQILETATEIVYQITEYSETDKAVLLASYFSEESGVFTKKFQKSTLMFDHDVQLMAANFVEHIKEQTNIANTKRKFENALEWVCHRHEENAIKWWLAGSGALFARGIDVTPHDIDIMTYKSEIGKIHRAVKDKIVEPFHHVTGWVVKGFGVISQNFRIDYAFEPEDWVDGTGPVDFGPAASAEIEEIKWKSHTILVPRIHYHLKSNQTRNRVDVVEKIQKHMTANNLN
ncbi:MAG TPA: hypothetical protein PL141_03350 [Thermoflexales bacterium]|nr:hypothetical protein [Thermoflexales bacterium]HQW34575.1 hypothetical protein [Thermoflexales bacterium]